MLLRVPCSFISRVVTKGELLLGALLFSSLDDNVESVESVYINDKKVPPEEYTVYLGDQDKADPALINEIPGWQYDFRKFPYIALMAKYDVRYFDGERGRVVVTADVVMREPNRKEEQWKS